MARHRSPRSSEPGFDPCPGQKLTPGAALASVLVRALLPPLVPTIGSAFVAGLGGGVLYVIFTRVSAHRTATFTIVILGLATVDSIMIATLPMAGGALPRPVFPIAGLVVPVRQLAPLLGLAQFSSRYFPRDDLVADTVVHSVTAGAVAWLVPPWIGWKSTPA